MFGFGTARRLHARFSFMSQQTLQIHQPPLSLNSLPIGTHPASSAANLSVLELPLKHGPVYKVELPWAVHLSISHFPLKASPNLWRICVSCNVEYSPAVGLIVGPLAVVLQPAIGKEELPLAMHHIVLPASFVVAPIFENVLPFAVLQIPLLLTDILATLNVLLMHVHQFLALLLLHQLPAFAELPLVQRLAHCGLGELGVASAFEVFGVGVD